MQVVALLSPEVAQCRRGDGADLEAIDLSLLDDVAAGDWLLVFLGAARSKLTAEEARQVANALSAVELAMTGQSVDHLFADLVGRTPELPPHLRPGSTP